MKKNLRRLLIALLSLAVMLAMSAVVFAEANEEDAAVQTDGDCVSTIEAGEYGPEDFAFTTNATGKVSFSCEKIIVDADGKVWAEIKSTSDGSAHIYMGFAQDAESEITDLYDPSNETMGANVYKFENKKVTVPVALNKKCHFAVRSTKMSQPHWIRYTYNIDMIEPYKMNGKSTDVTSTLGMWSPSDVGTKVILNENDTLTVFVMTKPAISSRYIKYALLDNVEPTLVDNNNPSVEEKNNAAIPITKIYSRIDKYIAKDNNQNVEVKRPYYWSEFSFDIPLSKVGEPLYIYGCSNVTSVAGGLSEYTISEEEKWTSNKGSKSPYTVYTWTVVETDALKDAVKEQAISQLKDKYPVSNYSGNEKTAIEKLLAKAEADINAKTNIAETTASRDAAIKNADAIKTDAVKKQEAEDKKVKEEKAKLAEWNGIKDTKIAKVKSVKAKAAKKKVTVKWKSFTKKQLKKNKVTGYEVQWSLNKNFPMNETARKVVKKSKKSYKITKLTPKKTYYVRVRAIRTQGTTKYVGDWTKRAVKVK